MVVSVIIAINPTNTHRVILFLCHALLCLYIVFNATDLSSIPHSTGMDALISELKNGRVTLRRRQAPRDTKNAALQELFAVLEHSQQQNRQSKTFLINHKYNLHEAATTTAESEQF